MPTHSGRSSRLVGHPCPRLVKGRPRSPKHPASPPYLSHRRVVLDVECADGSTNAVLLGIMRPPTRQPSPRVDRATLSVGATLVRTCVRVDQGEPSREIPALVGDRSPVSRSPGRGRAAAPGARRCARGAGPDGARETSALRPRRHAVGWTAACRAPARPRGRSLRAHPRRTPTGRTRDAPAVRATTPGVTELAPHPSEARTRGRWRPRSARRGRRNTSSIRPKNAEGPTESGLEQYRHGDSKCARRGSTKPHFALASGMLAAGLRWIPLGSGRHLPPPFTHQSRLTCRTRRARALHPAGWLGPLRLYLRSSARARTACSQIVRNEGAEGITRDARLRPQTRTRRRARAFRLVLLSRHALAVGSARRATGLLLDEPGVLRSTAPATACSFRDHDLAGVGGSYVGQAVGRRRPASTWRRLAGM